MDTINLNTLQASYEALALDLSPIEGFIATVPDRFKNFVTEANNLIRDVMHKPIEPANHLSRRDFDKAIGVYRYVDLMPIAIYIPMGLSGSLLEYAEVLKMIQAYKVSQLVEKVLKPTLHYLAMLITHPENMATIRDLRIESGVALTDMAPVREAMQKVLAGDAKSDRSTYGQVVRNHEDFREVIEICNSLTSTHAAISQNEVMELTDRIATAGEHLLEFLNNEHNTEHYKIRGQILRDLSELLYGVAQDIELYAHFTHSLKAFAHCISEDIGILNKVTHRQYR